MDLDRLSVGEKIAAVSAILLFVFMFFERSEEHTSELQSHLNLVCRLLLEKKKRLRAYPNRVFTGNVTLIYPHLMAETRTARIRSELPTPDEFLPPPMHTHFELHPGANTPV